MKTTALCCLGLLLIFGTMLAAQTPGPCLGVSGTAYVNWPQFHSDPCHTGYNASEFILSPANVGKLDLDWKYNTCIEIDLSSPTVANGLVDVGDESPGAVYALNAITGAKLWSFTTAGDVESAPAVANGIVYFGGGDAIYALNALTGATLWIAGTGDFVASSPAVANGVV